MAEQHQHNREAEEKYMMLQIIDAQIKDIEKELEALEQRSFELIRLKVSLDSLAKSHKDAASIAPIGLGTYAFSEIKETKEVLVNVGAGVMVRKDIPSANEMINAQLHQSDHVASQLTQNVQNLAIKAQQIESEIKALLK